MASPFFSKRQGRGLKTRERTRDGMLTRRGPRPVDDKDDPLVILKDDIEKTRKTLNDPSFTARSSMATNRLRRIRRRRRMPRRLPRLRVFHDRQNPLENMPNEEIFAKFREKWRKSEDTGLSSAIRFCSRLQTKITSFNSVSADEAVKLSGVYNEICKLLQTMTSAYQNYVSHIYIDEDHIKKYYNKTCLEILELWGSVSVVIVDMMVPLIQQYWERRSEFEQLSKDIAGTCTSCVKFTTLAVNTKNRPIPNDKRRGRIQTPQTKLVKIGEKVTETATDNFLRTSDLLSNLVQAMVNTSLKTAEAAVLESTLWLLFSVNHVAQDVLKSEPPANTEDKQQETESSDITSDVTTHINTLMKSLDSLQMELSSSYIIEKGEQEAEGKIKDEEECKTDQQAIEKLANVYESVSDKINQNGSVSICNEDPGGSEATIYYKPDIYPEVASCSIGSCDMKDRDSWLDEIPLSPDHMLISDIYIVKNGPLKTTKDVEVDFTYIPMSSFKNKKIHITAKQEGAWSEVEITSEEVSEKDAHLCFKTKSLEAFTAFVEVESESVEVPPEGTTYTCSSNTDIKVTFPEGMVNEPQSFKIKILPYDFREVALLKERCPDCILGTMVVSDAVEIRTNAEVNVVKNTVIQLPMDDEDDPDTQLVVIRFNDTVTQVLDRSQCHLKKDKGIFIIETKGVWGVAVARIRKIFLNMRDTIKKEFQLIFGMVQLCNICTFINDTQRDLENGSFFVWIECVDKSRIKEDVEAKRKAGLIEVKNSRSKDFTLRQNQTIVLKVDGQIRIRVQDPPDMFKITYLIGADNHVNIPMEVHRDHDKIPYAAFNFHEGGSDNPFFSVNIPVRDLSELPTDEVTAKPMSKTSESSNLREMMKQKEEVAASILSHDSLMNLSRKLSNKDGRLLGVQLGVDENMMTRVTDECDGDILRVNFQILCQWRGKTARSAMVDFLISSLKTIGRNDLSCLITTVGKHKRGLLKEDLG